MMRHFATPAWLIGAIAVFYTTAYFKMNRWPTLPHGGDAWGYYAHLPSALLYGDIGNYDRTIKATAKYDPNYVDPRIDKYGIRETATGKYIVKYPIGVAVLELPFFGVAHAWALNSGGQYDPDGYSRPYMLLAGLGGLFYGVAGLLVLWLVLVRFFPGTTAVALVCGIALGTNLFYFSVYNNVMSHAFLFFLHAALIWATIRFWEQPGLRRAAAVGLALGLIAITRTQELMAAAIPLLWGITGRASAAGRWLFFRRHWRLAALAALVFLLAVFPQMLYWKYVSGSWAYFSYQGETFDFRHPHIWQGLTSFRNGWLAYTPLMAFALLGLWVLRRFVPAAWWPFWGFFPLHVYVTYSWWCWMYINGFGSRPMVETYALLALPLGACWQWAAGKGWKKILNWGLLAFFVWLNIFQTWQLKEGILWSEAGNRAYYRAIFGTLHPGREALIAYDSGESQPRDSLVEVAALVREGFENSSDTNRVEQPVFAGRYALRIGGEEFAANAEARLDAFDVRPNDWLRVSVRAYVRGQDKIWNRDQLAQLVVELPGKGNRPAKVRGIRVSSKIGNPQHSIWDTGDTDRWGEAVFFVKVPARFVPAVPNAKIKVYIWNPGRQKLFVDDLTLGLWRKP